ncbi:MAG: hypothetical protein C0467_29615 [Planctomycetaceae bacterium]|nr:hypothetical protein [Planctomycetaceae bacterium]
MEYMVRSPPDFFDFCDLREPRLPHSHLGTALPLPKTNHKREHTMQTISKKSSKTSGRAAKTAANTIGGNLADEKKAKLDNLATQIQSGHRQCVEALRGVVTQAVAIGTLLKEAKKLVGHGRFKAWVEGHCQFAMRMAQNYMLVAGSHERIVAKFGNDTAGWTLTDFINLARKLEDEGREQPCPAAPKAMAKPDPFRLPTGEVEERQRRFQTEIRGATSERVAKEEALAAFVRGKINALYAAVRRFVASKEVVGLTGEGLDAADLGMLLIDSLKDGLDPAGLLVAEPNAKPITCEPLPVVSTDTTASETQQRPTNGASHSALVI